MDVSHRGNRHHRGSAVAGSDYAGRMERRFVQVDVFSGDAYRGNPLAVVIDGDGIDDAAMQRFANWTNLSETTFLSPPIDPRADYRVRIFTASHEMPFAGHPTLGSCHAWLQAGGSPKTDGEVIQECGVGLVRIRQAGRRLAFASPPLLKSGPVEAELLPQIAEQLGLAASDMVAAEWIDNGPGWMGVKLADADAVLAMKPNSRGSLKIGVIGAYPVDAPCAYEVRALFPSSSGAVFEDPVTGSLNASLAQWFLGSGQATSPYVVSQGTVLGRRGRVFIEQVGDDIWVGGDTTTCVSGSVAL